MDTLLTKLPSLPLTRPSQHLLYTTTSATALLALLIYSRNCYVSWHALGEGGVPRDIRGWLMNVVAHLVARRDHRGVPAPYERVFKDGKTRTEDGASTSTSTSTSIILSTRDEEKYGPAAHTSFFPRGFTLPPYAGPRPTVPTTVLPQRQTTRPASPATLARQAAYIAAVAAANPSLFAVRPSALESPKFEALWLVPGEGVGVDPARAAWLPPQARGEVAHVHHEGSAHMCLGLVDAAEVVRRGWGERHKMSGVAGLLPWGYVLVYAPREGADGKRDWEVWKQLVIAASRVVARSAGFEGEVVVPE
ncbi:hypothetical protein F4859DRAFT_73737 [Xylaria cf. heliscus]|nr:hypothetical protein F4859DRAFT_73737 [Xylaria cf. heliscus]